MEEGPVIAWRLSLFSKLYEGPLERVIYLAERVTTQLIGESNAVPIAPPSFIIFPFTLEGQDLAAWRADIHFEGRLDAMTAFEDYQGTLMLPLRTALLVSLQSSFFISSCCIFYELIFASNPSIG